MQVRCHDFFSWFSRSAEGFVNVATAFSSWDLFLNRGACNAILFPCAADSDLGLTADHAFPIARFSKRKPVVVRTTPAAPYAQPGERGRVACGDAQLDIEIASLSRNARAAEQKRRIAPT